MTMSCYVYFLTVVAFTFLTMNQAVRTTVHLESDECICPDSTISTSTTVTSIASTSSETMIPTSTSISTEPTTPTSTSISTELTTPISTSISIEPTTPTSTSISTEPTTPTSTRISTEPTTPTSTSISTESTTSSSTSVSTEPTTTTSTSLSTEPTTPISTSISTEPTTPASTSISSEPITATSTSISSEPTTPTSTSIPTEPTTSTSTSISSEPTTPTSTSISSETTTPTLTTILSELTTPTLTSISSETSTPTSTSISTEPPTPTSPGISTETTTPTLTTISSELTTPTLTSISSETTTPTLTSISSETTSDTNVLLYRKKRGNNKSYGVRDINGDCVCKLNISSIATPPTTTAKYATYTPSIYNTKVEIKLEIKIGNNSTIFNESLRDTSSSLFTAYRTEFETKLSLAYNNTPGFIAVEVYSFRPGSVIAQYHVILKSYSEVDEAATYIQRNVIDRLTSLTIQNMAVDVEFTRNYTNYTVSQATNGCEMFSKALCQFGDVCKVKNDTSVFCISPCNETICGGHGDCYVDSKERIKCSCHTTDRYAYSGEFCNIQTEKLDLKSDYIIAIAASGGGVLFIISIILLVLLLKNRRGAETQKGNFKSDNLSMSKFSECHSSNGFENRPRDQGNLYQTGILGHDVKYVQGREHRVSRSDNGEETYIYQPNNFYDFPQSITSFKSDNTHVAYPTNVYNHIDTVSKFEIKRPNINIGHMNKF